MGLSYYVLQNVGITRFLAEIAHSWLMRFRLQRMSP